MYIIIYKMYMVYNWSVYITYIVYLYCKICMHYIIHSYYNSNNKNSLLAVGLYMSAYICEGVTGEYMLYSRIFTYL